MPNLQDVAKLAGVSTATVSKVLSNTPYVSETTRQKVIHAIAELDYRPNLAARALVSGKTHIIAVVFPYLYDALFKDPLVLAILEGIEDELSQRQYNLLLSTPRLSNDGMGENYLQLMRSGYIEGIIAIDSVPDSPLTETARQYNIPLVVLGYHNAPYCVHSDDYSGGKMIMEHILELGHQQIGIVSVPKDKNLAVNERLRGMQAALQQRGLALSSFPFVESNFSTKGGASATNTLLEEHPYLTAIVCANDRMAIGAIQYLNSKGYRVPEQMTVVGYDNLSLAEMMSPALTTISQHATQLGRKSAEMLMALLNNQSPSTVVLPPTLIKRGSSGTPRLMDFIS